ncbi:MAG: GPH family glycoside/pentoside/hexuronide:cation symporter [Gammaproteobacteria bacterium]
MGVGILPAIFLREKFSHPELTAEQLTEKMTRKSFTETVRKNAKEFIAGFIMTLQVKPFMKLCAATFLVFNGFMLISAFGFYVIIYYVFSGDTELGAEYAGWAGTLGAISSFVVIGIVTWLSTRYGKRKAFFIAIGISMIGYAMKWFCYNPEYPLLILLPAPFMAFGLGGLFTLMGSMIADVCDYDELNSHERREGMFGSIYWWVVKLGMALALGAGGFLLNSTGFDVALEGNQTEDTIFLLRLFDVTIPLLTSILALWAISKYTITEERAQDIRIELENRRQ